MLKPKQLGKPLCWRKKATRATLIATCYQNAKNPRTKKTLWLKKIIFLSPIIEMAVSQLKLWVVCLKEILVCTKKTSKTYSLILQQLAITLILLRKTKSKATETWVTSNALLVTKKSTTLTKTPTESQKTSVGLGNLCVNNWDK